MTRPNGVIQLYPLVRIALMLIVGIVLADAIPFFSNPTTFRYCLAQQPLLFLPSVTRTCLA